MFEAANYSATDRSRDGRKLEIRALRPEDKAGILRAIERTSAKSLYRRFFGTKRYFSDKEVASFINVDFVNHVALVAVVDEAEGPAIVAGGRYVVEKPGVAEVAFAVIDDYQGHGIGSTLLRHLAVIARQAGLKEFVAEVLPENAPMLRTFEKSGLKPTTKREADAVDVTLRL
jgi:GNAT superfamily N-acetyltransferase